MPESLRKPRGGRGAGGATPAMPFSSYITKVPYVGRTHLAGHSFRRTLLRSLITYPLTDATIHHSNSEHQYSICLSQGVCSAFNLQGHQLWVSWPPCCLAHSHAWLLRRRPPSSATTLVRPALVGPHVKAREGCFWGRSRAKFRESSTDVRDEVFQNHNILSIKGSQSLQPH